MALVEHRGELKDARSLCRTELRGELKGFVELAVGEN